MGIDLIYVILLMFAGMFAGFVNTIAFGGSLLTLPTLRFLIPLTDLTYPLGGVSRMANGTNRVAILFQNFSAILGFRRKGISNLPICY